MSACITLLRQTSFPRPALQDASSPKDSRKTRVFTTGTLCLWSGDFPQSQQSVVEKKAWVSTCRTCVFKSDISSVCSFVASLHCVTQRGLASPLFIASCEPIREAVTSMLATSRVTNQMRRSIWATRNFKISLSYLTLLLENNTVKLIFAKSCGANWSVWSNSIYQESHSGSCIYQLSP